MAARNRLRIYELDPRRQRRLAKSLDREKPDLICVATFPFILSPDVLQIADGINVHMSLLPRHRGPDPLFWTYLSDDHTAGVTVNWLNNRPDSGPILLQREIALARGHPIIDLYYELAAIGGELLAESVRLISEGNPPRIPQDDMNATAEPSRAAGTWRVDIENWPAERVWHVIRGLTVGKGSFLGGRSHGSARTYTIEKHDRRPGSIEQIESGWRVFCVDGYVDVERA
jgi:methionyl-tRNA formyltransferase